MIVSQPYKTQSWNMTHLQLSSWSEGVGALGLVWAHPMVASSFSLFFFQCIHPSSFSVCFHVTKNSFHSAHVSIELYRLPAFPLALDSGYISTLKLKGGKKKKTLFAYSELHSCHIFSICSNKLSFLKRGLGGGGRLFDFVIWSCLLHSYHKAATMWSFLCTVTMAIFLMSSTVHLKEVNWWPERMRWLKRKKKSFIKMLNWVYQDYLG